PVKPIYVAPRHPMVLCHGLYGFDVRGPEKLPLLQFHYWRGIREALEQIGAKVVVAKVASTGGVHERAQQLDTLLKGRLAKQKVNIVGHSMGGLDARYMITHVRPTDYEVSSLTTVCTPHRGSPFMDWCRDYLSLGYRSSQLVKLTRTSVDEGDYLQRSVALLRMAYRRIMATLDTPAYACLTTDYCNRFFNPATPDVAGIEYLSYGAQMDTGDVAGKVNPLTIPHDIIYRAEGPNDGLVSLTSAQWGHYLGTVTADHFDLTNRWRFSNIGKDFVGTMADWGSQWATWLRRKDAEGRASIDGAASAAKRFDAIEFYLRVGTTLYQRGF
ncbi:alpha/beta-hydrolase, partial [Linderina pennispora]